MEIERLPENGLTVDMLKPLAREIWAKAAVQPYPVELNLQHLVSMWNQLSAPGLAVAWVIRDNGVVVGILGAVFFPDVYTGKLTAFEQFWAVGAEYRGGTRAALRLWKAFEEEARRRNCEQIAAGTRVGTSSERMDNLYRRMGFVLLAHEYRKLI
jgi:hypothetical protein